MYGVDTQPLFSDAVVTCFYTIDKPIYYINTSEIPSEISHENFISSRLKITCYQDNMLSSSVKRPLSLWLHNKSCL